MASTEQLRKGHISEDLQLQARKAESPVVNELLVSARKGFSDHVLELLQEGGSAKAAGVTDKHGRNCLQLAALHGHIDTVLVILRTQLVGINSTNKRGLTPLHDACTEGHTKIALLLLAMGAYILGRTKDGWTCLMCTCSNGHLQLAQIIIAAGCDINAQTRLGLTALHIAAWKGHTTVVEALIKAGCNTLAKSHNGKSALHLAQEENQHECVTILQAANSKQSEDPVYRIAALEGQLRICQDKLVESHRHHDDVMVNEHSKQDERLSNLKSDYEKKLTTANQEIDGLKETVEKLEKCLEKALKQSAPVEVKVETPTPPMVGSPSTRKRKVKRKSSTNKPDVAPSDRDDSSDKVKKRPESRPRSASSVSSNDKLADVPNIKLSPEIQHYSRTNNTAIAMTQRRQSVDKLSITDLVAESLKHPGTMSVIRKELKADGLTPKIERKFHKKSLPATLPAMPQNASHGVTNGHSSGSTAATGKNGTPFVGEKNWTRSFENNSK